MEFDLSNVSPEVRQLNPGVFQEVPKKPRKYHNVPRLMDGMSFDSGKEATDARDFMTAVAGGAYIAYLHHVTVKLPGNITMELDHVLINNQFEVEIFDSKSSDGEATATRDWKNKAKLFEETYGKKIKII